MKIKLFITVIAIAVVAIILLAGGTNRNVAAVVNGSNIYVTDLPFFLDRSGSLRDAPINQAIYAKLLLLLAYELGIIQDPSIQEIWRRKEETNVNRRQQYDSGGIVFGLVSFDENTFFSHFMSNLYLEATRAMSDRYFNITEYQVREYHDNMQELEHFSNIYSVKLLEILCDSQNSIERVQQLLARGETLEAAAVTLGEIVRLTARDIETNIPINERARNSDMFNALSFLSPGEVSRMIETEYGLAFMRLDGVRLEDKPDIMLRRTRIRINLERQSMENFMEAYIRNASIVIYEDNIDRFIRRRELEQ